MAASETDHSVDESCDLAKQFESEVQDEMLKSCIQVVVDEDDIGPCLGWAFCAGGLLVGPTHVFGKNISSLRGFVKSSRDEWDEEVVCEASDRIVVTHLPPDGRLGAQEPPSKHCARSRTKGRDTSSTADTSVRDDQEQRFSDFSFVPVGDTRKCWFDTGSMAAQSKVPSGFEVFLTVTGLDLERKFAVKAAEFDAVVLLPSEEKAVVVKATLLESGSDVSSLDMTDNQKAVFEGYCRASEAMRLDAGSSDVFVPGCSGAPVVLRFNAHHGEAAKKWAVIGFVTWGSTHGETGFAARLNSVFRDGQAALPFVEKILASHKGLASAPDMRTIIERDISKNMRYLESFAVRRPRQAAASGKPGEAATPASSGGKAAGGGYPRAGADEDCSDVWPFPDRKLDERLFAGGFGLVRFSDPWMAAAILSQGWYDTSTPITTSCDVIGWPVGDPSKFQNYDVFVRYRRKAEIKIHDTTSLYLKALGWDEDKREKLTRLLDAIASHHCLVVHLHVLPIEGIPFSRQSWAKIADEKIPLSFVQMSLRHDFMSESDGGSSKNVPDHDGGDEDSRDVIKPLKFKKANSPSLVDAVSKSMTSSLGKLRKLKGKEKKAVIASFDELVGDATIHAEAQLRSRARWALVCPIHDVLTRNGMWNIRTGVWGVTGSLIAVAVLVQLALTEFEA